MHFFKCSICRVACFLYTWSQYLHLKEALFCLSMIFLKKFQTIFFFFSIFIAHVTRTSRTKHLSNTIESLNRYGKIFLNSHKFSKSTFIREILSIFPCSQAYSRSHKLFRTLVSIYIEYNKIVNHEIEIMVFVITS